ncbi:MAG: guanylate kinase [Bacteroidetes bacterium]|nr:MAG: guanylate kinase [Bacteroidota bacterium]
MSGKLIIFSAPSGAGKTTIVHHLLKQDLNLEFSISACSRDVRAGEQDAIDYYFLGVDTFKEKIDNEEFLEWEEVYPDQYYGTLKSEVDKTLAKGKHLIFDVDVVGGLNIKDFYSNQALSVFVMPPSIEHLKARLLKRSTESETSVNKRVEKAASELQYANRFDEILLNDDRNEAFTKAETIVKSFLDL